MTEYQEDRVQRAIERIKAIEADLDRMAEEQEKELQEIKDTGDMESLGLSNRIDDLMEDIGKLKKQGEHGETKGDKEYD